MRRIGTLPEEQLAKDLIDVLAARGITGEASQSGDLELFAIWVHSEAHLETAKSVFSDFSEDPARFQAEIAEGRAARRVREKEDAAAKARVVRVRPSSRSQRLTVVLIVACIAVALLSRVGAAPGNVAILFISTTSEGFLPEVLRGQVWRLFTPIFLHFGVIHLVFNMFWLFDLGRSIENRMGTATLLGIVVTSAGISNLAQYLWSGFDFGGMSGVVYALFGYCWLRGWIRESTVFILLGWLLFCMTGLIGNIANAAHVMGLVVGVAWGWSASRRLR